MRVFLTPPTASDFDMVAAMLRDAGHTVSGRTQGGCSRAEKEEDTRTLFGSDFVVVLNGWRGCPESETDVLTAHGAGIAWGTVDDALAAP
jgi:ABC-type phosphate transport system auxiliary subunit